MGCPITAMIGSVVPSMMTKTNRRARGTVGRMTDQRWTNDPMIQLPKYITPRLGRRSVLVLSAAGAAAAWLFWMYSTQDSDTDLNSFPPSLAADETGCAANVGYRNLLRNRRLC